MKKLDIAGNRSERKYSPTVQAARLAWALGRIVFRGIPRPLYGLRRGLLKMFGAKVGKKVHIANTATIYFPWNLEIGDWSSIGEHAWIYNLGRIRIGEQTTISQRAHLCAGSHDYTQASLPLLKPGIDIGGQVWICADAFVGPGIHVEEGAVVGACSVVIRDVEAWTVVAGNPAKPVKKREIVGK